MGRTGSAGDIVARFGFDTRDAGDNDRQSFVVVHSVGPVKSVGSFTSDRSPVNFANGAAIGAFAAFMWSTAQLGAMAEPALAFGAGAGTPPGWTAQHKLSGLAASTWTLRFDTKSKLYQNGVPAPMWVVEGGFAYDPRKDSTYPGGSGPHRMADPADTAGYDAAVATWEYTENPYLHALKWVHGIWQRDTATAGSTWQRVMGMGAPAAGIDIAAFVDGANVADANGWKIGGVVYSGDGKWDSLKKIMQAGMGEPLALGARISCLVNAPKVSLATITIDDVIGDASVGATQPRRDRINTITPRYRLESNNWKLLPGSPISIPEHVVEDRGKRSKVQDYPFIQHADQVATAVRYDIENAREFGPIVLPLKLVWMGYKPGDCVTAHLPELGLNAQQILLLNRDLDPSGGIVTMTARSETAAKHPFALGQTTTPPPTPGVSGPALIPVPGDGAWAITGNAIVSGEATAPALIVTGAVDAGTVEAVIVEYRPFASGQAPEAGWASAGAFAPDLARADITGVRGGTAHEVAVSYQRRGITGNRRVIGPVTTSGTALDFEAVVGPTRPDPNATNSADPNSPFGGGTVDMALQKLDRIEPITIDLSGVRKASIDQAAIQRQATKALAQIAETATRLTIEQNGQRVMMRDAGFRIDPDSGQIRIYGLDVVAERTSKVEIGLNAATAQIALRATNDYVNQQIALAQLTPGQAADLAAIIRRVTAVEVTLDGVNATVALKADAQTVTTIAATVTSVSQTLDALAGVVRTKADSTTVDALGIRVGSVEQTITTLGNVSGISITIRQAQLAADKAGEAALRGIVTADDAAQRQIKAAAEVQQQLYTKITDDGAAEAAARLALTARVSLAEAGLVQEASTRVDAVSAQARRVDLLTATFTKADSDEAAARLAGDKANNDTLTTLSATVASQAQAITDGDRAQATRTDQLVAQTNQARSDGDAAEAAARLAGDKANSDALTTLTATVSTQGKAITDGDKANATLITQVGARLDGFGGTAGVTVEQKFAALVDRTGKIEGRYSVAIDTNNNLVGFQLIGSPAGPGSLNLINTDLRMGTGRIVFNTGTFMQVQGVGFGVANDLIDWFGPTMDIANCSRANGKIWKAKNGDAFFGGALVVGSLTNPSTSSSLAANAVAELPLFGSNGNVVTFASSWRYAQQQRVTFPATAEGVTAFEETAKGYNATGDVVVRGSIVRAVQASTITLTRMLPGGAFEQLGQKSFDQEHASFSGVRPTVGDAEGYADVTSAIGGGFTLNDPVQSIGNRTVRLTLARGLSFGGSGITQRLTVISTEQ